MSISMKSLSGYKLGLAGSITRSHGQVLEKLCGHSRGHSFDSKLMKLVKMLILTKSRSGLNLGLVGSKQGQRVKL